MKEIDLIELAKNSGCTELAQNRKYITARRTDGLTVFLDRDSSPEIDALNKIRLTGTKEEVIISVALMRFKQIAACYARREGVPLPDFFQAKFANIEKLIGGECEESKI